MTKEEFLNLPIGSTFVLGNRTLKVIENINCSKCCITGDCKILSDNGVIPECIGYKRNDRKNIIFVEVKDESME